MQLTHQQLWVEIKIIAKFYYRISMISIEESIPDDTPSTGTIRVVRRDGTGTIIDEQRYPYSSWNNTIQDSQIDGHDREQLNG